MACESDGLADVPGPAEVGVVPGAACLLDGTETELEDEFDVKEDRPST